MLRQNQMRQLHKVIEDRELVTRIRNVFFALNNFSVGHVSNSVQCSTKSTLSLPHLPTKSLDEVVYKGGPNVPFPMFPYNEEHSDSSYVYPMADIQPKMVAEMVNTHVGVQLSMPGSDGLAKLLQPRSNVINLHHHHQMEMDLIGDGLNGGDTSGWKDLDVVEHNATPFSINSVMDSINLCSGTLQAEKFIADPAYFPSNLLDSAIGDRVKLECMDSYQNAALHIPESSDMKLQKDLEKLGNQSKLKHLVQSDKSLKFSAGSELHEALGPAFLEKSIYKDGKAENTEAAETIEIPEAMSSSHLTLPSKSNKKRARPGENSRPRPRDRQLIQDRIKELRELVPNKSKCSIDSLLEHSIKHMLFLQSITKHC